MKLKEIGELLQAAVWIGVALFIILPLSEAAFTLRATSANKRRNSPTHHKINLAVLAFLLLAVALIPLVKR